MSAWLDPAEERARQRAGKRLREWPWPQAVRSGLARLRAAGGRAWLVGGSVRDVLLGRGAGAEVDVATDLVPERVRAAYPHVVPIGAAFGTMLALWEGVRLEITTLRREGSYSDARHPDEVAFTDDPLSDLDRRDLTVNALAFDPATGVLLDPHGGALDLERRLLRAVGEPADRFREDALRPLRVARLAAVLAMEVEGRTRAALGGVLDCAPRLAIERVRGELEKLMRARQPSVGWEILREAQLLALWLPELQACRGVVQNRFHAYDVYFHSLYSCDAAPPGKPAVRWAALLHDLGKPATRAGKDGEGTFYGHDRVGAELADAVLGRLRFPNAFRVHVVRLVREHMFDYRTNWSDAVLRRWLRRVGVANVADLFDLRLADAAGNGLKSAHPAALDEFAERIRRTLEAGDALTVRDLAVDGEDVMRELGVPPGRAVGEALNALLAEVLERPSLNERGRLLDRLRANARESRARNERSSAGDA